MYFPLKDPRCKVEFKCNGVCHVLSLKNTGKCIKKSVQYMIQDVAPRTSAYGYLPGFLWAIFLKFDCFRFLIHFLILPSSYITYPAAKIQENVFKIQYQMELKIWL